jgi:hypothetical protein
VIYETKFLIVYRYSESIDTLYSSNKFATTCEDYFEFLPRLLLPQRIDTISSVRFKWHFSGDTPSASIQAVPNAGLRHKTTVWVRVWDNLAKMKGLGELQIELVVFGPAWEKMPEAEVVAILEPLRALTTPKHFELVLPFPIGSSEPKTPDS